MCKNPLKRKVASQFLNVLEHIFVIKKKKKKHANFWLGVQFPYQVRSSRINGINRGLGAPDQHSIIRTQI